MILLSLNFLHSKNIIHRDLKPNNLFIKEINDGIKILKVGDFGISLMDLQKSR